MLFTLFTCLLLSVLFNQDQLRTVHYIDNIDVETKKATIITVCHQTLQLHL